MQKKQYFCRKLQIDKICLVLKYVDTKKCHYEVQNYKSGQDEDCP